MRPKTAPPRVEHQFYKRINVVGHEVFAGMEVESNWPKCRLMRVLHTQQTASPKWAFDDATFERTAASFNNPDHVAIVIHNYRWRLGLAAGDSRYDDLEQRLAAGPVITAPTITLEGDANGAPHADSSSYASKFPGKYAHRLITGGIGHNLPQEAPQALAQAVVDVDWM
jgi:pimeloyl-ACP methyl ester carboxylesterase